MNAKSSRGGGGALIGGAPRGGVERIKTIAEDVARNEHDDVQIMGVIPGEGRRGYAEIVVVRRGVNSTVHVTVIGVDRDLTDADLREQISRKLRA